MMGTGHFADDFRRDAVLKITERGYPAKEVAARCAHTFALCPEAHVREGGVR